MGCFNTVMIECPHCGEMNDEQTKNGDCILSTYSIHNAPPADLMGVSGYPIDCIKCDEKFIVKTKIISIPAVFKYGEEYWNDSTEGRLK